MKKEFNISKKQKLVALLAPSFVAEFSYPEIISQLKTLGFDKVIELTFGAKMINRDYHQQIKKNKSDKLMISSVCPGIVETINSQLPQFKDNLLKVDSPMIATSKICKKIYPYHKVVFISPCYFKKAEASKSKYVDFCIDYQELRKIFQDKGINLDEKRKRTNSKYSKHVHFDKFYNDYTKIYPLSGGLSKTAHLKGVLKKGEEKVIDGIDDVLKFLKNPDRKVKFLDVTFCKGGCIGGPCLSKKLSLIDKRKRVISYMNLAKDEKIPQIDKGNIVNAKGLKFSD